MAKTKTESYEVLYAQLLEYIETLETGNLALDESLKLYEEALKISEKCQKLLESAQQKLTTLESVGESE